MKTQPAVTLYWRPGCPYCSSLRRGLRRAKVETDEINIWECPEAAARVRALANGNETVPTVVIRGTHLVNPTAHEVLAVLQGADPFEARRSRSMRLVLRWVFVSSVIVASFLVDALGYHGLSWGLDGVALGVYLVFRMAQR